jgi:uncharacterized protein (DUF1330 family)
MSRPGFVIGQITVKDYPEYIDKYGMPVASLVTKYGGEFLVASRSAEELEGEWYGNWTVVIRFPSKDAALAFYNSTEYAPLLDARTNKLSNGGNLVIVEGFAPNALPQ